MSKTFAVVKRHFNKCSTVFTNADSVISPQINEIRQAKTLFGRNFLEKKVPNKTELPNLPELKQFRIAALDLGN